MMKREKREEYRGTDGLVVRSDHPCIRSTLPCIRELATSRWCQTGARSRGSQARPSVGTSPRANVILRADC